ncbi:MAG: hypothetical protein H7X92_02420 [Chitinophagales bacterium]|nr:hypothetical protein [Hyphomicrobiales bacterium]
MMAPGDAVVSGFSGIKPMDKPVPPGGNPLDEFFIDLNGASAQILSLTAPGGPPQSQLISAPPKLQIRAEQTGQVFAIGLDNGQDAKTPNIYLGATSAYGLHIVLPDADGDGAPERVKTGHPNAEFMPGQFGPGGSPGSIWKVDAMSGAVSLFATLPENSGPGVGDVVFDKASRQFFASDLDNGLIYRLGQDGAVIDSFDHGVIGRPAKGLGVLPDDGAVLDIKSPAFDSESPDTWGYTQKDRMVWGLALTNARLYYAVAGGQQVWSIGIALDGSFAGDPRWEFDVTGLTGDGPITDMLFDAQGRLTLAQRGAARGSYDYSQFAEPEKSAVVRYQLELPDNPATESIWDAVADEYAIGMPAEHTRAEGGVALGYAHDENGALRVGACNTMLWSTGHRLRASAEAEAAGGVPENDVHGLQGADASLVRPQNTPPQQSYFADYDGLFGDAAKSGHMGDVEIWQPCNRVSTPQYGSLPPGYLPPLLEPPGDFPPDWTPPGWDYETNLRLKKWSDPKTCVSWGGGWLCRYRVRITNTGPDTYFGPILVRDWLPAAPAGAVMGFSGPWACWATAPASYRCWRPGVFLVPGSSAELTAFAWVPKAYDKCHLTNGAAIEWAPPGSIWNSDPTDDIDFASAAIPAKKCKPEGKKTDLKIYKEALLDCFEHGDGLRCGYKIRVENQGPGAYNGDIVVEDTIPAGTTAIFSGPGWACGGAAPTYTCTYAGASLPNIGDAVSLIVRVDLSIDKAKELNCKVRNRAEIIKALGGSDKNTDPNNDTASAVANAPARACKEDPPQLKTNLKIEKKANPKLCEQQGGGWWCTYQIRVINTGPGEYNGSIEIEEALPAEPLDANWNAPWNCVGMGGGGGGATCTHPNTNIAANASKILTLKVKFANDVVKEKGCKLPNVAKIKKAPGGTDKNTNPGDDIAGDTALVPEDFCKIEPTNLELQKYGAQLQCNIENGKWRCPYAVIVKNMGPGEYNGEVVVKDWLPANAAGATMTVQAPWVCVGAAPSITCTHPEVNIPSSQQVVMYVDVFVPPSANAGCSLLNTARILEAPGGSPQNTNAGDDQASAALEFPPLLSAGQAFCHTPVGAQPCPPGFKWDGERCDRPRFCPQGTTGVWPDCRTPDRDCPRGWTDTPVKGKCCPPGKPWNEQTQECGRDRTPPPPPQACPSGFRGEYPDCWKPGKPEQCQKTARCLNGRVWNKKACACVCPPGKPWTGEKCGRDLTQPDPVCPKGSVGTPPNCRKLPEPNCPRGTVGNYPNCRAILRPCPKGYTGFIPNCRKIVVDPPRCPRGLVGTPPNCRRIEQQRCPAGMFGRPPRCRYIERPGSRPDSRPRRGRFDPRRFRPGNFGPGRGQAGNRLQFR